MWIPKYLNSSPQFAFWELEEFIPLVSGLAFFVVLHSFFWLILGIVGCWGISKYKTKAPKGFLQHFLYIFGICEYKGYPPGLAREFLE